MKTEPAPAFPAPAADASAGAGRALVASCLGWTGAATLAGAAIVISLDEERKGSDLHAAAAF